MVMPLWIDHGDGPERNPDLSEDEFKNGLLELRESNLTALWAATDAYENSFISGTAKAIMTTGAFAGLPKCLACLQWVSSIWNDLYYARKSQVTYQDDPALRDFTSCGDMPYSVPDIEAEVQAYLASKGVSIS